MQGYEKSGTQRDKQLRPTSVGPLNNWEKLLRKRKLSSLGPKLGQAVNEAGITQVREASALHTKGSYFPKLLFGSLNPVNYLDTFAFKLE